MATDAPPPPRRHRCASGFAGVTGFASLASAPAAAAPVPWLHQLQLMRLQILRLKDRTGSIAASLTHHLFLGPAQGLMLMESVPEAVSVGLAVVRLAGLAD